MIIHVPQKKVIDCAVATTTMISNRRYSEVAAYAFDLRYDNLIHHQYMSDLLTHFTGITWRVLWIGWRLGSVRHFVHTHELCVALMSPTLWKRCTHCIVLAGGT